jgi:hypothetical protein
MGKTIKRGIVFFSAILLLISITSCEYEFIQADLPDLNYPVSFSNDILPIFTIKNNCTSCHRTGGTSPDLTLENAYNSIMPDLIDAANPELSIIYTIPGPSSLSHDFKKYTHAQAALVIEWIIQGAENN